MPVDVITDESKFGFKVVLKGAAHYAAPASITKSGIVQRVIILSIS